jgi:hypothetical protein
MLLRCGLRVSLFLFSTRPFNKETKGNGSRPGRPRNNKNCIRWRDQCLMDTNSVLALLGPVSPSLAAYHYLRSPTDNPASRCSRCGHVLVPGISHSRIVPSSATQRRKKTRPSPNTPIVHCLKQSCATCGHVNNTLLSDFHRRNVMAPRPYYPAVTVTPRTPGTDQCPLPDPPPLPSSHPRPTPQPSASPQPQPPIKSRRSRPKHKAGLQEMLARNKERQHEAANRGTSGLTTLLHGL